MLLAIDSGNTNVVFALIKDAGIAAPLESAGIAAQWRIEAHDARTGDEYFVWLSQLMALKGLIPTNISNAIICNVRPASAFALGRLCREHLGIEPLIVGNQVALDIRIDQPEQLGADRIVNAIAAQSMGLTPAILIDMGTATTFDVLAYDGAYVGGMIAPGLHVSAKALAQAAAQLPLVSVEQPPSPIGTDTRTALQSGLFWGYVSMLEGMIARTKAVMVKEGHAQSLQSIQVVGTGGLMKILAVGIDEMNRIEPDLTLKGLKVIFETEQQRAKGSRIKETM